MSIEWLKKKVKKKKKVEDKTNKITKIPASAYFPQPTMEDRIYNQTLQNRKNEEKLLLEMRALAHAKQLKIKRDLEESRHPVYVKIKSDENDNDKN